MAVNKTKDNDIFTTKGGLKIKLKTVDPAFIQRVMRSVPHPKRPTYEAKTFGGRFEVHPLDEESAKQTPGGLVQWEAYQADLTEAQAEQNDRVVKALFMYGTECEIPENGWAEKHEYLGVYVPREPDMRRAHYLSSELTAEDLAGLTTAILKRTGVSEEAIQEAEAAFRSAIRDKPE